ncbi:unnamed protein product, partial [Arabidopsis halleri]
MADNDNHLALSWFVDEVCSLWDCRRRRPPGAMFCQPDHLQLANRERNYQVPHNMANLYTLRKLEDEVLPKILERLSHPELGSPGVPNLQGNVHSASSAGYPFTLRKPLLLGVEDVTLVDDDSHPNKRKTPPCS